MAYLLRRHVYVRALDRGVIWLDLRSDRYYGQPYANLRGLSRLVPGWPPPPDEQAGGSQEEGQAVAEGLTRLGLLTSDGNGKSVEPLSLPFPELGTPHEDLHVVVRWHHLLCFIISYFLVYVANRRSFEHVVAGILSRKRKKAAAPACSSGPVTYLTAVFHKIRPYVYTSKDNCLFDSEMLVRFLAWYRVFPTFVIGVQEQPFVAHCFVQSGSRVLNDELSHARRFRPILAI